MYDEYSHPLLAQVPLTVSPFVSLPTATTLPYTYKSLPSGLPPSSTTDKSSNGSDPAKPKFVFSSSGQAVHPDEILESCRALESHLKKLKEDAIQSIDQWENDITERELAEKRRVAPGWLDRNEKILQPERAAAASPTLDAADAEIGSEQRTALTPQVDPQTYDDAEGAELDRAFGSMKVQ